MTRARQQVFLNPKPGPYLKFSPKTGPKKLKNTEIKKSIKHKIQLIFWHYNFYINYEKLFMQDF